MRDSFVFYRSFADALSKLPAEDYKEVSMALIRYALDGEDLPNLSPIGEAIMTLVKPQIDANNRRFENGKKGGRPKKKPNENQNETKPKPNQNQDKTTPEPNVNDNVNDNVNVNVNDNDNVELSSLLSKTEWDLLVDKYDDVLGLIDLADDMARGKTINNPYRYVVGIAENRNWITKGAS